ncbi:MAG TPA: hypothetical protein VGV40_12860, partial [Solirubrobacteraceae bacterium]|nr:hypothetical protein [Solirubrobacteraceae bacterium]
HQLEFTEWITTMGRVVPALSAIDSSYLETVLKMTYVGYPGGSQAALGGTSSLLGIDPLWAYQAFLALVAGALGLALYSLLSRAIASRPWRAIAAGVAAQPTILYSYALAAGIKELSAVAGVTLLAAVLVAHPPGRGGVRQVLPAAVALAGAYAVFNLGILPWAGMVVGSVFVIDLATRRGRLRTLGRWAAFAVAALVVALPTHFVAIRLAPVAAGGGPPDLGNLAAPVSAWSSVGPWLVGDHRFPLEFFGRDTATFVLIAVVLAFAAVGILRALRVRDVRLLALAVAGAVAFVYVTRRTGPWVDLKVYTITAPLILALAFAGAAALWRWRRVRWLGPAATVVIAGGVLLGNAFVYQATPLVPYERFADLKRLGEKYAGQGPAVLPVFEEFGEYLLRDVKAAGLVNPPRGRFVIEKEARPNLQFVRDPDELNRHWLNEHRLLILRRDPTASRPPSNWEMIERTEFYDVWRRDPGAPRVVAHLPLAATPGERDRGFCRKVRNEARAAGDQAVIAYSQAPSVVQYAATEEGIGPSRWRQAGPDFFAAGPGRLKGQVSLPVSAPYKVWLRGSFGREVRVLVDGEKVGSVRWQQSYPGQYERVGTIDLPAGDHTFEIIRGGGSLLPGTANEVSESPQITAIGPLAFSFPDQGPRVRYAKPLEFREGCRAKTGLDWVEVVVPASSPAERSGADTAT